MAATQTITSLNTGALFDAFMKTEMKCSKKVIDALDLYQGIDDLSEFKVFESKEWEGIAKQLLSPPDKVVGNKTAKQSPIIMTAVSLKRLKGASIAVRYYDMCGYTLTVENMKWPLVEEVSVVVKSLHDCKERSQEKKLTKLKRDGEFPMWLEKNLIQLDSMIGMRAIPLSYLIRDDVISPPPPALLEGKPYSAEHGSVEMVMIECATHNDPLFSQDDRMLFDKLATAWSGTELDTCITAQMQRSKKGRILYLQSVKEFANKAKWMEIVSKCEEILTTSKFLGTGTKYSMNMHISRHRNAFSRMQVASKQGKANFVLMNETTRVRHFITSIEDCKDQKLVSRIESVLSDDGPNGKNNNFDLCVQHLLPACPVHACRKKTGNDTHGEGSKVVSVSSTSINLKQGRGKTGVDLRWHKTADYKNLSNAQKDELREWQQSDDGKRAAEAYKKTRAANKRSNPSEDGSNKRKKWKTAVDVAAVKLNDDSKAKNNQMDALSASLVSAITSASPAKKVSAASATVQIATNDAVNAKVASILKGSNIRFEE